MLILTGFAQTTPAIPVPALSVESSTGSSVASGDYVKASTEVTFICTYNTLAPVVIPSVTDLGPNMIYKVDIQREVDGTWQTEVGRNFAYEDLANNRMKL